MHVVGDQRHTRSRVDARHRPVVAAGRGRLVRRLVGGAGKRSCAGNGLREHARGVGAGRLDAGRIGGIVRRIPVRMAGVDESDEVVRRLGVAARWPRRARGAAARLVAQRAVLQLPPHRVHHEHRIFRQPGARFARAAAGIPRAVRAGDASPALTPRAYASMIARSASGAAFDHATRHRAEAETPRAPVLLERHGAEQLGQLAGREAARQVHLEEAVLRVRVTRWHRPDRRARRR